MYSSRSLDYITIDSLSSLEFLWLDLYSAKLQISFKNLYSLKEFHIYFPNYKRSPMKLEFQSLNYFRLARSKFELFYERFLLSNREIANKV